MLRKFIPLVLSVSLGCGVGGRTLSTAAANPATEPDPGQTNRDQSLAAFQRAEQIRNTCIAGRRLLCGKILQVLPDGLVVDSGYPNLLREPLIQSWLVPRTASARKAENLLEENEPGAICIGLAFLTDFPKGRKFKPAQYDYVIIEGYPAGQYTYTSAAEIKHTIRRFSAGLDTAIKLNLKSEATAPAPGQR